MKKILAVLLCAVLIIGLTGCSSKKQSRNENISKEKNYKLEQINSDCNLENITFLNENIIIANGKIYLYSTKKYNDTGNHCKLVITDNPTANFICLGRIYFDYHSLPEAFTTDGYNLYSFKSSKSNLNLEVNISDFDLEILKKYRDSSYYYYDISNYFTDKEIMYKDTIINIPTNEKILYVAAYHNNGFRTYIITDKNSYILGKNKNDKCYEYEDVKCTYKLIETDIFDEFFDEFKDKILYFNGEFLVTKDNKMYKLTFSL